MFHNIQWIFFDVGSTLVDESMAYQHRIENAISGTGITYQHFYDTMLNFYRQNKKGDLETLKLYQLPQPKWYSEDEVLYPDAKKCLRTLSSLYKIGIIANQPFGTRNRLDNWGILNYINLVVASSEEGVSKPDKKIFRIALEKAGCLPQNAVMVGDRLDNDIAPAKSLGMKTVRIKQGFGKYAVPENEAEKADYTVNHLNEICQLFIS